MPMVHLALRGCRLHLVYASENMHLGETKGVRSAIHFEQHMLYILYMFDRRTLNSCVAMHFPFYLFFFVVSHVCWIMYMNEQTNAISALLVDKEIYKLGFWSCRAASWWMCLLFILLVMGFLQLSSLWVQCKETYDASTNFWQWMS